MMLHLDLSICRLQIQTMDSISVESEAMLCGGEIALNQSIYIDFMFNVHKQIWAVRYSYYVRSQFIDSYVLHIQFEMNGQQNESVERQALKSRRSERMTAIRSSLKLNPSLSANSTKVIALVEQRQILHNSPSPLSQAPTPHTSKSELFQNAYDENYISSDKLGEGAHGIVRKCLHRKTGQEYAVKVLKTDSEQVMFLKSNFIDIKSLKHENIVRYKAIYLDPKKNVCHLIMENFPFPNLNQVQIKDQDELKSIFRGVLNAMTYAHQKNICHRDLKPDNILYDQSTKTVKIIDFGTSKNFRKRGHVEDMLTVTGTMYYRAPEMFLGGGYDLKVDSWAIGATLYKMIHGKTPFESQYHNETISNILNRSLEFDSQKMSKYSSVMKNLIVRLLKKDKKERISVSEAKQHIWFTPTLEQVSIFHSDIGIRQKTSFKDIAMDKQSEQPQEKQEQFDLKVTAIPSNHSNQGSKEEYVKKMKGFVKQDHLLQVDEYKFDLSDEEDNRKRSNSANVKSDDQ